MGEAVSSRVADDDDKAAEVGMQNLPEADKDVQGRLLSRAELATSHPVQLCNN